MKKFPAILVLCFFLAACTPGESAIQTAVAQTRLAAPGTTPTLISNANLVQTAVAATLTPAAAAAAVESGLRIQAGVMQTLTALAPTITLTPRESPTPATPTPTLTLTHTPWPTITNTIEPFIASGPISLVNLQDSGSEKVLLTWQAEGSFEQGLYVVWSPANPEPAYPGDYWTYFPNGHTRSATVDVKTAKSYYFRVCEFAPDRKRCINYSNTLQLEVK